MHSHPLTGLMCSLHKHSSTKNSDSSKVTYQGIRRASRVPTKPLLITTEKTQTIIKFYNVKVLRSLYAREKPACLYSVQRGKKVLITHEEGGRSLRSAERTGQGPRQRWGRNVSELGTVHNCSQMAQAMGCASSRVS